MTEQVWNFAGIEGGAGELGSAVQRTDHLLDEGKSSLAALASVWGGTGSDAYQAIQMRWDASSAELNAALLNLAHTVSGAGQTMADTERAVTGKFG